MCLASNPKNPFVGAEEKVVSDQMFPKNRLIIALSKSSIQKQVGVPYLFPTSFWGSRIDGNPQMDPARCVGHGSSPWGLGSPLSSLICPAINNFRICGFR